jgi:hypothetical protein
MSYIIIMMGYVIMAIADRCVTKVVQAMARGSQETFAKNAQHSETKPAQVRTQHQLVLVRGRGGGRAVVWMNNIATKRKQAPGATTLEGGGCSQTRGMLTRASTGIGG